MAILPRRGPAAADGSGLIKRFAEIFFNLGALFRRQNLIDAKIVFYAVVANLLIELTKGRQLLLHFRIVSLPGLNGLHQRALFETVNFDIIHVGFKFLMQRFYFSHLLIA